MDRDSHHASTFGDSTGPLEARRAWILSKKELRAQFGEGAYQSYIERLDFALEENDERVFLARDGGTQSAWIKDKAIDKLRSPQRSDMLRSYLGL